MSGAPITNRDRAATLLRAAILVALGSLVFWPAIQGGWLWDDNLEVTQNPVFRVPGALAKIWSGAIGTDYLPLKSTLQWLQWQAWHDQPAGYHAVSIALHLISALLVWRLLDKLHVCLAWLGGLLFAVHPLTVESVAWIAEQKNTTSLPLLLLSACCYLDYDEHGRRRDYFLAVGCFLAAVLCKASVVMLPMVLLLHGWWKRGRIGVRELKATAPFFLVSLGLGLATIWFQQHRAIGATDVHPGEFLERAVASGLAMAFYLAKSLVPVGLLPVYPRWAIDASSVMQWLPWPLLAVALAWFWARRATWGRHALLGAGFFLINLAPVLGFVPMSYLRITRVADHFAYLPLVGVIGLAVAGAGAVVTKLSPWARYGAGAAAVAVLVLLGWESHGYTGVFHDSSMLWTYTLERNPVAWPAHNNLGALAFQAGRYADAEKYFTEAARLNPDYAEARFNLGEALFRQDRVAEAAAQFEAALRIRPEYPEALNDLGSARWRLDPIPQALDAFRAAMRLQPDFADPHANLGSALLELQQIPEAISQLQEAMRLRPDRADVAYNLGNAFLHSGKLEEAAVNYERAIQLKPDLAEAHSNLGEVLLQLGRPAEAVGQFEAVLRLHPDDPQARQDLIRARTVADRK